MKAKSSCWYNVSGAGWLAVLKILLLSAFFWPAGIEAQEVRLNFSHLTINDGLSHNRIFDIIQDKSGFIWIASLNGIDKYDGYGFHEYKPANRNGLSSFRNEVHVLLEDSQEQIWVGTINGLKLLDSKKGKFIPLQQYPNASYIEDAYISSLLQDKKGNIWIGSYDGLSVFDLKNKAFAHYLPADENEKNRSHVRVRSLYQDTEDIIWVGLEDQLKRFDPARKQFLELPEILRKDSLLGNDQINIINQDAEGNYWFGSENHGLFQYHVKKNTLTHYTHQEGKNSLPGNTVRDIYHASAAAVWVGTREGLSIFTPNKNSFTNYTYDKHDPDGLTHNSIWRIMKDDAGSIWLGTYYGGINIFHPDNKKFHHIREQIGKQYGVNHRVVSSVVQDAHGALWLGTEGGGLNYIDRAANQYTYFTHKNTQGLASDRIKALAQDQKGNLWIGTYDGLSIYHQAEKRIEQLTIPSIAHMVGDQQIYSLATDEQGIWIGTNGAGLLFRSEAGQFERMIFNAQNEHSISSNNISSLLNVSADYLWVGTSKGLNLYNKQSKTFTQFLHNPENPYSITNNSILGLFRDSRNWIWIGTDGGGLNVYDPESKKFYFISEQEGLANNVVQAIQEDARGDLWVSTNRGLSKIILKNNKLPLRKENISIHNYTVSDGLQSNQFLISSAEKGNKGELFFGGINGVTAFFPEQIVQNTTAPKVVLTDFLIHNKQVNFYEEGAPMEQPIIENPPITLAYDQAFITFRYAALNYVNPAKNQFAYKLEGLSKVDQWNYVGGQRSATFTNLEAGDYIFKVKAANNDGIWNENATQLKITVLPPYWKTWWAYCIYALFISCLLFLFYSFSLRNEKLKSRLLYEHMAHEKEQELNQQKLMFFTNISHEIKTPLTLILAPLEKLLRMNEGNNKVNNQLMLMQRNGERLTRLINQLLDFRKFESGNVKLAAAEGNIVKFTKEIFIAFEVYTHQRNLHMQFFAEREEILLWFDRDKLEKILFNLLSNAIKFTPEGGQISVHVKLEPAADGPSTGVAKGCVVLEVVDNGAGISAEHLPKIFDRYHHFEDPKSNVFGTGIGLAFSKGLVELHKGEISVTSRKAVDGLYGNTCFRVKLPLGNTHLGEDEKIANFKNSDELEGYEQQRFPLEFHVQEKRKKILEEAGRHSPIMLVVDDNREVLQFVADNFREEFEVHTAMDGVQGLEVALELIPDIIISDVMMPRMSGIDFCKALKTDSRSSHIPVILLTARTPLIFKLEGLEIGADDYITKPFNLHFLEARVWNLLDSRQKLRDRYRQEFFLQPKNVALNSPDEQFLEKAIQFIEDNIAEPTLNVEELGREIGMSRNTLYRKVKALTNQTVVEFIRSFRLKRAAQLLEQNKLQVNEIAYMVGFQDVDYFRKCFKEQFGHTPSDHAKRKLENGEIV
jgi:ligand-binding sensor domain-containing protein/signal transduction histidine kinase/DNA-binding response OmpR family regulator